MTTSPPLETGTTVKSPDPVHFTVRIHVAPKGNRCSKLLVPSAYQRGKVPLLTMRHSCHQNADYFAAGTRMNEQAQLPGSSRLILNTQPVPTAQTTGIGMRPCIKSADKASPLSLRVCPAILSKPGGCTPITCSLPAFPLAAQWQQHDAVMYPELCAALAIHCSVPLSAARDSMPAMIAMQRNVRLQRPVK